MIIINLFFTPLTGLYLFLKRKEIDIRFSANVLFLYIIFLSWNIPFTKLFIVIARKFGLIILPESASYTLVSLIASILVFGFFVLCTEFIKFKFTVKKKKND